MVLVDGDVTGWRTNVVCDMVRVAFSNFWIYRWRSIPENEADG
jgi:hypothetical protein